MPVLPNTMRAQQGPQPPEQAPAPAPWVNPYDAVINEHLRRMEAPVPPMYSPEQGQLRTQGNDEEMQLGMLAQLSGNEALGGAGGQVFKNALAMRQPKVTERGVADQLTGKFQYSPDYLREKDEARLSQLQQLQANTGAAHQEHELQRISREEQAQQQRDLQRTLGQQRIAISVGKGDKADDNRNAKLEDAAWDDYQRENKNRQSQIDAHRNLTAISKRTDAASDIAFIYSYMKILDPTSVVREGEFATAQNAASVPDRIRNAYNATLNGTRLNPQQRTDMLATAGSISDSAYEQMSESAKTYAEKAKRRGLNPENIIGDLSILQPRKKKDGSSVDVGAALRAPGAAPPQRALPQSVPQPVPQEGGNRMIMGPI
jgi:hypothetical protein